MISRTTTDLKNKDIDKFLLAGSVGGIQCMKGYVIQDICGQLRKMNL
jgi:hypothetical protein